ncbi:PREDICTED: putative phosphatidylglycerol/phosphatidylinositol transfer protein DDB_G0282107 [Branchiostoma belcheri]|uniref:Phosphatidylglycerol/phosphatidylinositol transfer protein DDB_G0282107 n=1 Tax=Branchiostoma belcheri TaxID=7741 RepID=A0A6P4ZAJ2_BRABE|nr:PREDICTED: putative phosphatidylglycerol/phosphatidylinositol transfer protein DDB_G0282107 [Branchiostoma belcheri]XP_019630908.1 PREDICTED: putative phosphatidylglycerol/phosphatidylinositol transfer protein DDB_G0282107 [Branchiostoma belcheri]XP_019630909.1 PREDICTED: putative phosphatidylglycerol/phosphatidylinositol transfer protein DDB_G0282107 [Branchiostoma belcheri]KAI8484305.1 Phosphatidylglycerol/phosphatidylinositol transfer protein [Branchiostoma belcheri]
MAAAHLLTAVLLAVTAIQAVPVPEAWLDADSFLSIFAFKGPVRWSNCGDPATQSFNGTVTPNPPVRGQKVAGSISFVPDADLIRGKIILNVWYNGSPAIQVPFPICTPGAKAPEYCPMKKGVKVSAANTVAVPNYLKPGHYNGTAILLNQDNHQILCVQAEGDLA